MLFLNKILYQCYIQVNKNIINMKFTYKYCYNANISILKIIKIVKRFDPSYCLSKLTSGQIAHMS
jgi:hypothetical protein